MELLLIIITLLVLDIAAANWGADSRPGLNDPERARLQGWRGFSI